MYENFTMWKVSHITNIHLVSVYKSLKLNRSEITHVQKPSCFGHWVECHVIAMLSKNNYSGINTLRRVI